MSKTPISTLPSKVSRRIRKTSDALEILDHRFTHRDAEMRELVEKATVNAMVAKLIYEARTAAKLTQKQLADLVETKQPVIARLEDAEYDGHSLSMLHRIAQALNRRLDIKLAPARRSLKSA